MPDTADTTAPRLIARKDGAVGWMIFSNPAKLNAVTFEMWRSLPEALAQFASDPDVRLLALTGDGERAFVSGADISEFETKRAQPEALEDYNRVLDIANQALADFPKPALAKIRGICVGGGLGLVLNCDLRYCADNALFRMPAARLGLGYGSEGIQHMIDVIGVANTADLFFSARKFDAAEALRIGLVNRVFPAAELDGGFAEVCATIAENAPLTIAAAKRAIRELAKEPAAREMNQVRALYDACFASEDYAEGRRAFLEKRAPKFQGR